eukprot:2075170-Prorocentrum_lima.AAC.1
MTDMWQTVSDALNVIFDHFDPGLIAGKSAVNIKEYQDIMKAKERRCEFAAMTEGFAAFSKAVAD